jgi:hypothetical protein
VLKDIDFDLWNERVSVADYVDGSDKYYGAILEQYKLYVEMADRVSSRRGLTNTFFLTLNTSIYTALVLLWGRSPAGSPRQLLVIPLIVLISQCGAWYWMVRSYRQLNAAKYLVVGALEERLPASPYLRAEWKALGEGKDLSKYLPLTHMEQWVPVLFAVSYIGGYFAVLLD